MNKGKNEKISVIISTYNRENYLKVAIESVLSQTYNNYEIIVIDDCSQDNTKAVVENIKSKKIIYHRNEKNKGCGLSRKYALDKYATGKYVIFLDDDDKFINNKYFEMAINLFNKEKKLSMVCGGDLINDITTNTITKRKYPYKQIVNNREFILNFGNEKYPKPIISVAIIKKEALEKTNYHEMKILNDTTIFLRALLYGPMGFINKDIAEYLVHGNNISFNCKTSFIIDNLDEKIRIYRKIENSKKLNFSQEEKEKWLEEQLDITISYFIRGSKPNIINFYKILKWYDKNVNNKQKIKEFKRIYKETIKEKIKKKRKTEKKSCLVNGYIFNNLGDDLFFNILFKRYPNVDFYFYPPAKLLNIYRKKYSKFKNVIFYNKEKYYKNLRKYYKPEEINLFPMICERAEKVDFFINIGGSIFIQNKNWQNDDRFTIKKHLGNKPSFIIGCNFGPGDKKYEQYFYNWFKEFDDVCFRDKESYNKFKHLPNSRHSDDIVLIDTNMVENNKNVAISLIDLDGRKDLAAEKKHYYKYIINVIKKLQSKNYKITLFSFCKAEGDEKAIKELMDKLPDETRKKLRVVKYKTDIDRFMKEWRKNKYVIGSRFHSIVLAIANGQEFIPISYSKKTDNYLKQYDESIKVVNIKHIKNEKSKLNYYKINKVFNAKEQFAKIDAYLNIK